MERGPLDDGEPAFPSYDRVEFDGRAHTKIVHPGASLRDYFAAAAPEASEEWIKMQSEQDRQRNPHGDTYKPPRRPEIELRAAWKFAYADAMIAARRGR